MSQLLPSSFLFRFRWAVPRVDGVPHEKGTALLDLPESCRLMLPDLDRSQAPLELAMGWNENGVGLMATRTGLRPLEGRQPLAVAWDLWFDMRATQTVHRATRFCQHFAVSATSKTSRGTVQSLEIARSREEHRTADASGCRALLTHSGDHYRFEVWFPQAALPGYDPAVYRQLGFYSLIRDSQQDAVPLLMNEDFPFEHDPSLWQTLVLED